MSTLDAPDQLTPTTPIWNTVLRYGGYCGAAFIVLSLLMYLTNFNMMAIGGMVTYYLAIIVVCSTLAVMAIRYQRDQLDGGYINYGKALLVGALTIFIGMLVSSLWSYVLINFIDPNYVANLKSQFEESWGDKMPPEALEEALKGFDKAGDLFNILKQGLMGGAFFGLIVGLITAAVMKKSPKMDMR